MKMYGEELKWRELKVLCKVVLKRTDNRFLVMKRSMEASRRQGCWDLPGGNLEPGNVETDFAGSGNGDTKDILMKVVFREVREETGIEIDLEKVQVVLAASGYDPKRKLFVMSLGYVGIVDDGVQVSLSNEHTEFAWVSREEFTTLEVGDDGGMLGSLVGRI